MVHQTMKDDANQPPISITFHDDNYGQTTAMWEAYYRYYFKDGNYASLDGSNIPNTTNGAYNRAITYGNGGNSGGSGYYRYGFDNDSVKHFFESIQIYQMSRKRYTCFTLVNPIISEWQHDTMENSSSEAVQNQMQIQYETGRDFPLIFGKLNMFPFFSETVRKFVEISG